MKASFTVRLLDRWRIRRRIMTNRAVSVEQHDSAERQLCARYWIAWSLRESAADRQADPRLADAT